MLIFTSTTDLFYRSARARLFSPKSDANQERELRCEALRLKKRHLEREIQFFEETSRYMERQQSLFDAQLEVARLQAQKLRLELGQTVHIDLLPVVSTNN